MAADDDEVAALHLAQDAFGWIADVLDHVGRDAGGSAPGFEVGKEPENTAMGVNQSRLVARPLVGAGSHRNGFWPIDRRRIENAETKQPRARPFRPLDGERRRAFAVGRAIEGDERRSQRGHDRQPMRSSEARDDVQAELPEIVLASTIERLGVIGVEVADLGTHHDNVAEHVAPADGVARVGRREAGALPPLVTPLFVADGEVISLGHGEHRVVRQSVCHALYYQFSADSHESTDRPNGYY